MQVETPEGLHENQYALKILQDRLAWPALPGNIKLVAGCIEAIAHKWRRSKGKAYEWLDKKLQVAEEQGIPLDYKFFSEAKYNAIQSEKPFKGTYEPPGSLVCRLCNNTRWKPANGGVVRCSCPSEEKRVPEPISEQESQMFRQRLRAFIGAINVNSAKPAEPRSLLSQDKTGTNSLVGMEESATEGSHG